MCKPAVLATRSTAARLSISARLIASARASRPLWNLLKCETTLRVPSGISVTTRAVSAPGTVTKTA